VQSTCFPADLEESKEAREILTWKTFPALALLASVDTGLRLGSRCKLVRSSRTGVVLGMTHDHKLRVQWDDPSDVSSFVA